MFIDERNKILIFNFDKCLMNCFHKYKSTKIFNITFIMFRFKKSFDKSFNKFREKLNIANIIQIIINVFF